MHVPNATVALYHTTAETVLLGLSCNKFILKCVDLILPGMALLVL